MLDTSEPQASPPKIPTEHARVLAHQIVVVRALAFVFAILLIHWADDFLLVYFLLLAAAAVVMMLSLKTAIPGLRFVSTLASSDRLAVLIVLVAATVIGYLHNANTWQPDGFFNRPQDIARWKTELILGVSLATPLAHWLASFLLPRVITMNGQRFASEFALYVNFSGIALVLWTGEAALSLSTLGAALILMVLAELTLYATR